MKLKPPYNIPLHQFSKKQFAFDIEVLNNHVDLNTKKNQKAHRHNYYEIFVFTRGGGSHMIDFKEHPIISNSLHFISPGMVHVIKRKPACTGYVITFPEELFTLVNQQSFIQQISLYHNHDQTPIVKCKKPLFNRLITLVEQLLSEYQSSKPMKEDYIRACLKLLIIESERIFNYSQKQTNYNSTSNDKVQLFRKLMDEHFLSIKSINEYAAHVHLSPKAFTQLIKKHTGITPIEHLNNRMLIEAKRLLLNTDKNIKEIAFALNFEDPAYFGRFFKKLEKTTPLDFRNKMRDKYHN